MKKPIVKLESTFVFENKVHLRGALPHPKVLGDALPFGNQIKGGPISNMVFIDQMFRPWLPEYREYVVFVPRIFHIHTNFSYF